MSHASPRSWIPAELRLPRWAFVAWLVRQRQLDAGPRLVLALAAGGDIEASRRARLMRDLVPQDA
jgi:hypothetical protein